MNRLFALALGLVVSVGFVAGCSPKVVPSKGPRVATTPDQVAIYQKQPMEYEILGTVTTTAAEGAKWDERGNADAGFNSLKAKAAALGANGVLLSAEKNDQDRLVTAGYGGTFYQVPVKGKPGVATAKAIYVLKK